jgi:WD40 repeat protein
VATASARRVFDVDPMCALIAHGHGILDLAWSRKSLFLLSASMDNTVRLWHPLTTDNCIR